MSKVKADIVELIQTALKELAIDADFARGDFNIEHPDELSHGDYATNAALVYAKKLGVKPRELAEKIVSRITSKISSQPFGKTHIDTVDIAGPGFINFHLSHEFFTENVARILTKRDNLVLSDFGSSDIGKGKTVLVEYSSPNIAKPFTVGHLRSTVIGDAIANILSFSGYKVIRDNHIGDWGTQFGKQIVAIRKWGDIKRIQSPGGLGMKYLVDLYVRFHTEAEKNPLLEEDARAVFAKLEKGDDPETTALYEKIVAISRDYFAHVYKRLNVSPFDTEQGEHFEGYEKLIPTVMADLQKANLLEKSEGAELVFFHNKNTGKVSEGKKIGEDEKVDKDEMPPLMITKSDGATLYATRDLATDKWRKEKYASHNNLTVVNEVGIEQSLYFKQIFEIEERLGYFKKDQRVHVAHGFYRFEDGKMSTRKGNAIWLEDILDEAEKRAGDVNPATAKIVGVGAIKFNDLKRESSQDIIFDWDEMMSIKGDSCPYLQYSCVRANSIVVKAKAEGIIPNPHNSSNPSDPKNASVHSPGKMTGKIATPTPTTLEKLLYRFPEIVERSAREYKPHYIATFLIELAAAFNNYYAHNQIVQKSDPTSPYKVALTSAFEIVTRNGLKLLGIEVPERM